MQGPKSMAMKCPLFFQGVSLEVPGPRAHETGFGNWLAQRTFPEGQASPQHLPHELPNPPSEGPKAFLTPTEDPCLWGKK
jgi:hypothetical protein